GRGDGAAAGRRPTGLLAAGLLDHHQRGEQFADVVGQFWVAPDVLGQRRPLAAAVAGQELLGPLIDGVTAPNLLAHGDLTSPLPRAGPPGEGGGPPRGGG